MEGKSTFFIELEETLNIINEATEESLVIIDELGRGTSTYDGMSIAYAVLKDIAQNIQCLTFFATHFHLLLEEFKLYKNITMCYMESEFVGDDLVRFLYKFKKGAIGSSFGLSVARLAGLPARVIEEARERTNLMNKEQLGLQKNQEFLVKFTKSLQVLVKVESKEFDSQKIFDELNLIK